MSKVLILCPTFDHADTLFASITSARAQTFTEWEMVVIGDGAPDRTFEILDAIMEEEPRIRAVRHPKGVRYGESYRDPVIRESDAEFVTHLADDDLWTPGHLAEMLALLERAEWVNQAELRVAPDSRTRWMPVNVGGRRSGTMVGISFIAYRRDAYLRLPKGWTAVPRSEGHSDRILYASFFRDPAVRVASTAMSTAIKFPGRTAARAALSPERRLAELLVWLARIGEPGLTDKLRRSATVQGRLSTLFAQNGGEECASLDEAFAKAGLAPAPADAKPEPAIDGAPMLLPLTDRQRQEAAIAFLMLRAYDTEGPASEESRSAVLAAHDSVKAWKKSIQALAANRLAGAIHAAADFRNARPNVAEAYVLSAELLLQKGLFEEAEAVIETLAARWPEHGAVVRLRAIARDAAAGEFETDGARDAAAELPTVVRSGSIAGA